MARSKIEVDYGLSVPKTDSPSIVGNEGSGGCGNISESISL